MKRLYVIFFTLFIIVNFYSIGDRWGTTSSYSSGKSVGTTRSVGVDPNGGFVMIYDPGLLSKPEQQDRTGIALGSVSNGEYLFDLAQCENDYFPQPGDTIIVYFSKREIGSDGLMHGYYGSETMIKDGTLHTDPHDPEHMNDLVIYEVPIPVVTTDRKQNYVTWKNLTLQAIGNQAGNPYAGYNLYFSPDLQHAPSLVNTGGVIHYSSGDTVTFTDDNFRQGYYFLTAVTGTGVEIGSWDVGPDGRPGYAGTDDNNNGQVDEEAELGYGDDVYKPTFSAPSNYVGSTNEPNPVTDLEAVDSSNKEYLQWSSTGDTTAEYVIYKSVDGGGRYDKIGETENTIFVDKSADAGDLYFVRSMTADKIESKDSNIVQGNPFNGYEEEADFGSHETILFPAWSKSVPPELNTEGLAYFKEENGYFLLKMADLDGNRWVMNDHERIYWASTISWGDYHGRGTDSSIYFTAIDTNNHTQIFVQNSNPNHPNDYAQISQGVGNWTDPNWADSLNQVRGTNMLACSIDGDIYVFDPDNSDLTHGNLIPLTDFFDRNANQYGDTIMCFQPKWSPDNTMLAFIVRYPAKVDEPAVSDIYIIDQVQKLIDSIDTNGNGYAIKDLNNEYLEKVTATHAQDRFNPIWSPSWSNDSTMISYVVDVSNQFTNGLFASDYDRAYDQLSKTNFDAYTYERGIGTWPLGMPEMNTSNSEGFVAWAPTGGDKFVSAKIDFGKDAMFLEQFIDPTIYGENGSKSTTAKKYETATNITVSDRDFASIEMAKDLFVKAGNIGIYPMEKYPKLPYLYKNIGSMRTFLIGGKKHLDTLIKVRLHYTRYQAKGNEEDYLFPMRYNEDTKKWENIYSFNIIKDEDENPANNDKDGGFVDIYTAELGTIGLFSTCHDGDDNDGGFVEDLDKTKVKVGPNPAYNLVKFMDVPKGTLIKIYNLEGSLIASSRNNKSLAWVTDHFEWVVKSDKNLSVASGIYLVTFRYNGKNVTKKLAIIK